MTSEKGAKGFWERKRMELLERRTEKGFPIDEQQFECKSRTCRMGTKPNLKGITGITNPE